MTIMEQLVENMPLILSGIALIAAAVSLVLTIAFYRKLKRFLSDSRSGFGLDNEGSIRDEIVDVVLNSCRLQSHFSKPDSVTESMSLSDTFKEDTTVRAVSAVADKMIQEDDAAHKSVKMDSSYCVRYADAYNQQKGSFYGVYDSPKDSTVYKLTIDRKNASGTFTLCETACRMVTECRDYLVGASEVSGSGPTIEIESLGRLSLENGSYVIEEPLRIKFL